MAAQVNIINDLSTLTHVPVKALSELMNKETKCIGSAIHDALLDKEPVAVLNIGIGSLSIDLTDMQCKFIPNKELKATIKRSLVDKIDPIEFELEQSIISKLVTICDEVV